MQQPINKEEIAEPDLDLYDRHAPALLVYLCQRISHVQDAEDLLVEVFLAAMKQPRFSQLEPDQQLAWLRRVAHNKMVDRVRHMTRLVVVSLDEALERESVEWTPEQAYVRRESYTFLYQAIARLTPDQQQLLQLRYGEGLRFVEIASRLHKSDEAVRKAFQRTVQRLRTLYGQLTHEKEN